MPPENKPAAPDPAMARPTMRTLEFGATAHTTEPTVDECQLCFDAGWGCELSKMVRAAMKVYLTLK
jgi:hypothetical protein